MVRVTNDDGSFGCVHSNITAEPIGEGRLRICFTEDVHNLILDEFYRAGIFAINSAGNTSSNGVVEFSKYYYYCTVIIGVNLSKPHISGKSTVFYNVCACLHIHS